MTTLQVQPVPSVGKLIATGLAASASCATAMAASVSVYHLLSRHFGWDLSGCYRVRKFKSGPRQEKSDEHTLPTFDDVIGCAAIKQTLEEHLRPLLSATAKEQVMLGYSRGFVFAGGAGQGKTLMAAALAGQMSAWASEDTNERQEFAFVEIRTDRCFGTKMQRVIDLVIARHAPCIVFIDELDHLEGSVRRSFLTMLDGFEHKQGSTSSSFASNGKAVMRTEKKKHPFVLVGCTSQLSRIEPALRRSGRMDQLITFGPPNQDERRESFQRQLHGSTTQQISLDVDLSALARETSEFSHSDIRKVCTDANVMAFHRAPRGIKVVEHSDLDRALHQFRTSVSSTNPGIDSEALMRRVAVHECGHCVIAFLTSSYGCPPKMHAGGDNGIMGYITIISDDASTLSSSDQVMSISQILDTIAILLGGTLAEQVFCGSRSTLCGDDLEKVRRMLDVLDTSMGSLCMWESEADLITISLSKEDHIQSKQRIVSIITNHVIQLLTLYKAHVMQLMDQLLSQRYLTSVQIRATLGSIMQAKEKSVNFGNFGNAVKIGESSA